MLEKREESGHKNWKGKEMMQQARQEQRERWLHVVDFILSEEQDHLQHGILKVYQDYPELCSYASDLAQLRTLGTGMEDSLSTIRSAQNIASIDQVLQKQIFEHPAERALYFLAELVKEDLEEGSQTH